jgi:hypothetical protein
LHVQKKLTAALVLVLAGVPAQGALADLLFQASLKNGDYGAGYKVDLFSTCADHTGRVCGDGNLGEVGVADGPEGVTFLSTQSDQQSNGVINWNVRSLGTAVQTAFRTQGTVSIRLKADLMAHVPGHIYTDNYGFGTFNNGQGTFGGVLSRSLGPDSLAKTSDDRLSLGWSTWHNNVWDSHGSGATSYGEWHSVGLAWGGPTHPFEIWIDGALVAFDDTRLSTSWGSSFLHFGSADNFALGDIHERGVDGENGAAGVLFSDIRIWNEYRALGDTTPPVPLPAPAILLGSALAGLAGLARRRPG